MELKLKVSVTDLLPESVALGTAAMLSQREKGATKYGQSIEDANLSASELVEHAQQEMADGLVYTSMLAKRVAELEALVAQLQMDGRADLVYWMSKDGSGYMACSTFRVAATREKEVEEMVLSLQATLLDTQSVALKQQVALQAIAEELLAVLEPGHVDARANRIYNIAMAALK